MILRGTMPLRIARLPRDERGYPVPRFASWSGGKPDFRLVEPQWVHRAISERRCFICGEPLGKYMAFVIGPMCAINRVSSEPPCHRDCAEFAVRNCPFICFPQRGRNDDDLPEIRRAPPGHMIARNPGVALVWVTTSFTLQKAHGGGSGALLALGNPVVRSWWAHGRPATLDEVLASIDSGLPELREIARRYDGPEGERELEALISTTLTSIREDPWPDVPL